MATTDSKFDVTDRGSTQFMGMEVSLAEVVQALSNDSKTKIRLLTELSNRELTMIAGISALNQHKTLKSTEVDILIERILALRVSHNRKGRMELSDLIKRSLERSEDSGFMGGVRKVLGGI